MAEFTFVLKATMASVVCQTFLLAVSLFRFVFTILNNRFPQQCIIELKEICLCSSLKYHGGHYVL